MGNVVASQAKKVPISLERLLSINLKWANMGDKHILGT
jgi:hypothetical protein